MTGKWAVIIPETSAVTNLVTNPSIETATTGYAGISASVAASSAYSRRGYQSLAVTPTATTTDGAFYDAVSLTSGTTYILAFDFRGAAGIPYIAAFGDTAGNMQTAAGTSITGTGDWQRIAHTYASTASAAFRVYITKNGNASTAAYYLDGVGVYALDHDPQHIDGDQADCYWTGAAHASTSARKANSRNGGEAVNFDDYAFYISEWPGAGMAEMDPYSLPYSVLPGSDDQGEKIVERNFSLVGDVVGSSLADLHSKRKALINAFRPGAQFWLVYSGGNSNKPVRIRCKYVGGLTMGKPEGFTERIALKFLATDPLWYEDGDEGASLTPYFSDTDANYVVRRVDGVWSHVNSIFNNHVHASAKGADGALYLGGEFTGATGSTSGDYVCKFSTLSSTTPVTVDNGTEGGGVLALATAPNGYIYAGGAFTLAGGRANTVRIAYFDGTQWQPLSTGIAAGQVNAMTLGQTGILYIGGTFTNHGDANGDFITSWTGSAFASLSTGCDTSVNSIVTGIDGSIYLGGGFSTAGGVTCNGVAKWDGSAFTALGSGVAGGSAIVYALAVDRAGNLYAGGDFTSVGGVTAANVAKWNGRNWEALGEGIVAGVVDTLACTDDGLIYAGSYFSTPGIGGSGIAVGSISVWNGTTWARADFQPSNAIHTYLTAFGNDLVAGCSAAGPVLYSGLNTITNNGTANAYPKITFNCTRSSTDTARVEYLENITTGTRVWLGYAMQTGEKLTIDLHPTRRSVVSSFYGSVIGRAILRNSDFADFYLAPGANSVNVFVNIDGAPTVTANLYYPVTHYSMDGSST